MMMFLFSFFNQSSILFEISAYFWIIVINTKITIFLILSLIILVSNIFNTLFHKKKVARFSFLSLLSILIIFFIFSFSGYFSDFFIEKNSNEINANILIVQENYNQDWIWRLNHSEEILNTYSNLSRINKDLDIIIWPEYTIPLDIFSSKKYSEKILNLSKELNTTIVVGHLIDEGKYHYDSASVFSKGKYLGTYNSIEPILFNDQTLKGENLLVFNVNNISYGIVICYEELNQDLIKEYKNKDIDILISIVNDQELDDTIGKKMVSEFVNYRAKEFNLSIIRSTNTGVSKVIDEKGNSLIEIKSNTRNVLYYELNISK